MSATGNKKPTWQFFEEADAIWRGVVRVLYLILAQKALLTSEPFEKTAANEENVDEVGTPVIPASLSAVHHAYAASTPTKRDGKNGRSDPIAAVISVMSNAAKVKADAQKDSAALQRKIMLSREAREERREQEAREARMERNSRKNRELELRERELAFKKRQQELELAQLRDRNLV